jgi:DNA ligase (NAD+)
MQRQGEPFKSRAYQKAQETIMTYENDISDLAQVQDLPGIGKTITSKLDEYMKTGTLRLLERERANPVNLLTKIYGVGPKKAEELVKAGVTSIEALRARPELLNDVQKIGLKYFEAIETRIPRSEIDQYKIIFQAAVPAGAQMEIVGSYRRGAQNSGDIDIIITGPDATVMKQFMDRLIQDKIVIEILSRGKTKSLTIAQLPSEAAAGPSASEAAAGPSASEAAAGPSASVPRRVDFLYSPPDEYAFALLYFTGSKIFNTVQRHRALQLGYSLNEHGLYKMTEGKKGAKITDEFPSEQAIFSILKMKYKEPNERIDGRAVQFLTSALVEPVVVPMQPEEPEQTEEPSAEQSVAEETMQTVESMQPEVIKKTKKTTLKKKPVNDKMPQATALDNTPPPALTAFKSQGIPALTALSEEELSALITLANDAYYCNQAPLMTDNEYDILREYILAKYPNNEAALAGHTQCLIPEKNKVKLPYEMWSMDKIKPDTAALEKWQQTYRGPYILSCKLDGVSGLYSTEGPKPKLYTRGNGLIGQDISHLIPFLRLPALKNSVVRGEFIVPKAVFKEKYSPDFANPRNFVAGIINQKKPDPLRCADVDFVVYEVLQPVLKPSAQLAYLTQSGFKVVNYTATPVLSNQLLSDLLIEWRTNYAYEIDGVICLNDEIYPRQTGNPAHAFAFKMVLSDQIAEAKVVGVIWTASKDGYLKPRVQIEPINLGGVKIEYATGFNAKFIVDQKIGMGALIRLTRSGDVIPHIIAVIQPAAEPQMPLQPYDWNETHVDIMLQNKADDLTVKEKNLTYFFTNLEVEGLGAGNAKKIIAAGFDTVPKILAMEEADFLKVAGFKQKMATKIKASIQEQIAKATLPELMHATNLFGRGFGTKKFQLILAAEPNILLTPDDDSIDEKVKRVSQIEGMAKKTAEQFIKQVPVFLAFLKETNLLAKLQMSQTNEANDSKDKTHPLYGKQFVMTGFRDKVLLEKLLAVGAEQGSGVRKNTFVLLVKDPLEETSKTVEAKALGIPILTPAELMLKYKV